MFFFHAMPNFFRMRNRIRMSHFGIHSPRSTARSLTGEMRSTKAIRSREYPCVWRSSTMLWQKFSHSFAFWTGFIFSLRSDWWLYYNIIFFKCADIPRIDVKSLIWLSVFILLYVSAPISTSSHSIFGAVLHWYFEWRTVLFTLFKCIIRYFGVNVNTLFRCML